MDEEKLNKLTPLVSTEPLSFRAYDKFRHAMRFIDAYISESNASKEKTVINFIMNIVKKDLKYDLLTDVIYRGKGPFREFGNGLVPRSAYDKSGNKIYLKEIEIDKEVAFSKDTVVVFPWHKYRYAKMIITLNEEEFEYHKSNHSAVHYPEFDLVFAFSGNHSIGAGVGLEKGSIKATIETRVSQLFDHVYTDDGEYWYNSHTNELLNGTEEKSKVKDFRIAILFELAKRKYNLENT